MKQSIFFTGLIYFLGIGALLFVLKPGVALSASFFIRDDASGGDCTAIGNWSPLTKTCLLTQNVQGGVVVVDNDLTLDGNGKVIGSTSPGSDTGVLLSSVTGVTLKNLQVHGFEDGIQLISANSNTLSGNSVWDNAHAGILLRSSSSNTLNGNSASATTSGGSGIWLWNQSNSNTVTKNTTVGNSAYGIFVDNNSDGNFLTSNSTSLDAIGIRLIFGSDHNTVKYNTMSNHRLWGMDLYIGANDNIIFNNNFIDTNTDRQPPLQQIRVESSSGNVFNLAAPTGGNYWNDYDSPAEGCNDVSPADGFCDQPYVFAGGPDNLPLTSLDSPVCSNAVAVPAVLWDPNKLFVPIAVTGVTDPYGDPVTITVTGVTQDEPLRGKRSGAFSPDAVIQGGSASVRAERDGTGNGRVYQLSFRADDGKGNFCTGTVKVGVPHSMGQGVTAIDDGQIYDSTIP